MNKTEKIDLFWQIIKFSIVAVAIAMLIRGFLLIPVPVEGNSMENTLSQGDMVIMEKISSVKRFDVVVFQLASGKTYIKRVIGLPGDEVRYKNDQLYINETPVAEKFLSKNIQSDRSQDSFTNDFSLEELLNTKKLGEDQFFVLGDNRRVSKDSRSFGAIAATDILGKARVVYYPLKHIRFIS